MKIKHVLTFILVLGLLAGALLLDLANRGVVWHIAWDLTGEEEPVGQVRGLVEVAGNLIRPQPQTNPMTPIQHTNVNPFGINTFLEQEVDPAKVEAKVAMIADAGFHWIRQQFIWADIEISEKGNFTDARNDLDGDGEIDAISAWEKYDRIVDLAEQYGLQIQARIDAPPPWTRAVPEDVAGAFAPPDDFQDLADFAAVLAERYRGRIRHYQVWNEPNIFPEWGNQSTVNPEAYTEMLCLVHDALKAVDPEIVVISGALAPTQSLTGRDLNDFIFLQRMYQAGAADCFDVLSVQGYGLNSGPTDQRMRPTVVNIARNLYIRDIMVANGDSHKSIWISEAAWNFVPSRAEAPDIAEPRDMFGQVTQQQAADYITRFYDRVQQDWPWIGVVNYWFFSRRSDEERNQPFYYFRMVDPDFDPQADPPYPPLPVYTAMKDYITTSTPTLYRGVHQADDPWAVTTPDSAAVIMLDGADFDRALQTTQAGVTVDGTAVRLRWQGTESLLLNGETLDGVRRGDWWTARRTLSSTAQPHTLTITAPQERVFVLDSITVEDRTGYNRLPYILLIVLGGGMLALAILAGWPAEPPGMRRAGWLLAVGVLLVAAVLRFHHIDAQSLWNDEGSSYVQATRSLPAIADNAALDIHPPGYYWLLHGWTRLLGTSEFGLRSLSAFASVLTVALTFALGRRLFGPVPALLAAAFVTLNTFSIFYAQEARMYALLALWGVAAMWALAGFVRAYHWRWGIALALFNVAGLYTQYAFPFVMLAQGIAFTVWLGVEAYNRYQQDAPADYRPLLRYLGRYVACNLLTIVLYLPWLATAWGQVTSWPSTGEPVGFIAGLADILAYFAFGVTVGSGTTIAVVFFLLFALIELPQERGSRIWWGVLLAVAWVAVSVMIFFALDLFREANLKFLLPAQVAFALWLGRGVWALWQIRPRDEARLFQAIPKAAAILGAVSLFAALIDGLGPLYTETVYQRDDYRGIAAVIDTAGQPDDAIVLTGPGQQEVFGYYYQGALPVYPLPPGYGGDDTATQTDTRNIINRHDRVFAVYWGAEERDPNAVVETTLSTEAYQAVSAWYGDVRLVRYATPDDFATVQTVDVGFGDAITLTGYALSAETVTPGDVLQVQLRWTTSQPLPTRYKVFVQLLNPDGTLAAQRDAEPVSGGQPTTTWEPGATIVDNHALIIPDNLRPANYSLILGLYNLSDPSARLPVAETDFWTVTQITVAHTE